MIVVFGVGDDVIVDDEVFVNDDVMTKVDVLVDDGVGKASEF